MIHLSKNSRFNKIISINSVVILLILWIHNISCLYEDDPCFNRRYKQDGICRLLSQCDKVLSDLVERDLLPEDCAYKDKEPIVCCPEDNPIMKRNDDTPRFTNSKEMCAEYAKSVFTLTPSHTIGAPPINISLCAHTAAELIFGGTAADLAEFPHMALVGYGNKSNIDWNCGGSLISEQWILTAAHCGNNEHGKAKFIRLGDLNYLNDTDGAEPQDFEVIDIKYHPGHDWSHYNDIALLKLNRKAKFTKYVRPACLWTDSILYTQKAIATGWGLMGFFGSRSADLLKVTLTLKDKDECDPAFKGERRLDRGIDDDTQICAGSGPNEGIKDTCPGDSGGPLQIYADEDFYCMYYVVGITSFGRLCGLTRTPGVFTRLSTYVPWIEEIVLPDP